MCEVRSSILSAERFFKRGAGQMIGVRGGACICACARLRDRRCWHVPVCQRAASRMGLRRPACGFQGGDRCPHEKLCARVHTRNHRALRGATGREKPRSARRDRARVACIVIRVCTCVASKVVSSPRVYMRKGLPIPKSFSPIPSSQVVVHVVPLHYV